MVHINKLYRQILCLEIGSYNMLQKANIESIAIKQKGAITLFVTSLLLVASLVMTLASYRHTHLQIKQVQNQLISRKAHWLSEGGIECAFAVINEVSSNEASRRGGGIQGKAQVDASDFDVHQIESDLATHCVEPLELADIDISNLSDGRYSLSTIYQQDDGVNAKISRSLEYSKPVETDDEEVEQEIEKEIKLKSERKHLRWLKGSWHDF